MKSALKYIFTFLTVYLIANVWQTRSMPHGAAPISTVNEMGSATNLKVPSDQGQIEFLYFFAPWCHVCTLSAPNAATVARWFPEIKLRFIALDYASADEVQEFAKEYIKGPAYLGNDAVRSNWSIQGYPTYAIVNAKGEISQVSVGYSTTIGMAARVLLARYGF